MVRGLRSLGNKHDNTFLVQKLSLRLWVASFFENPIVADLYGGYGKIYQHIWHKYHCRASLGDALQWLQGNELNYDIYDIDPYGSPWEALDIVNKRASREVIGIACTDGCVKREGQIRGNFPTIVTRAMEWDNMDKRLKAEVFYHYPIACRQILIAIMSNFEVDHFAVKEHGGYGYCGTAYFGAILKAKRRPTRRVID